MEPIPTWVDIHYEYHHSPMQIVAKLRYYDAQHSIEPIHSETLQFSLQSMVGPTPRVSLNEPEELRRALAQRTERIATESARLLRLKYLLDRLPTGYRFSAAEARALLEGIFDENALLYQPVGAERQATWEAQ